MLQNGKFPFPRAPLILRCSSRSCQMPGHLEESRPLLRGKPDFRSPVRFCRKVEGFSQGSNGSTFASETNFSHVTIHPESANCSQERAKRTFFCAENTFSSTERTFWHAKYVLACPERTSRSAESAFFLTEQTFFLTERTFFLTANTSASAKRTFSCPEHASATAERTFSEAKHTLATAENAQSSINTSTHGGWATRSRLQSLESRGSTWNMWAFDGRRCACDPSAIIKRSGI